MVHGWPDTYRLWDAQVEALKGSYRCVRFTLPGFDAAHEGRAYSLDEVVDTIRRVVEQTCAGRKATLLLHDWGCVFGYEFAMRHPQLVERVVGVDIGDAGSPSHRAELSVRQKLGTMAYQVWLALAWRIGGRAGDAMARWLARTVGCPTNPASITWKMGYPYAVHWLGIAGGLGGLREYDPRCPMLFLYGERKPFMFHSRAWLERVAARPGNRAVAFDTGHWIMVQDPARFNEAVLAWLATGEPNERRLFREERAAPSTQLADVT